MRTLYLAGALYGCADPSTAALVVDGEAITWIGTREAAAGKRADVDAVVDLGSALVTPAFVDAHVHVTETGLALDGVDLRAARSVDEVLTLVQAASRARRGRPVFGHGWDEALLAERRPPTRSELDRASAGGVVYLSRVDVHSAVVSSALAAAADAATREGWDASGRVERDAHHAVRAATRAQLSPGARRDLQRIALRAAAAAGIACVHEMSAPHIAPVADLAALLALEGDPAEAVPRVIAYRGQLVSSAGEAREVLAALPGPLAGLAGDLNIDGSVGSHTAAFLEDYADAPGRRGHLYLSVDQVRDHVAACTQVGVQAGFHVIGDAAVDLALRGLRRAAEAVGLAAVRAAGHRLEHVEAISAEQVADARDLALTASIQPAFDACWGGPEGMYAQRLGSRRALAMNPFETLAAAGVPLALGSDSPVTAFDPWGAVRAWSGHHVPEQRVSAATAFDAHTAGGWRAAGHLVAAKAGEGNLATGAPATFAVWDVAGCPTGNPTSNRAGGLPDGLPDGSGTAGHLSFLNLAPGSPSPTCLLTVSRGRVLHDGRT